ncbi:MAG: helix-turn-helix transcriptional regulator, partial [Anaerolineales bacterium]|nr:helix-turn-helix transcriptional regulator [Anaerolineales bacterium]
MTSPADSAAATETDLSTAEHVLQVATTMFARQGYHGASIREIARQVGISVATLYYYIGSKDDLYRQVFQRQYQ